ncbi:MAG: hypothetical protein CVU78_06015 [Elusimicrobia bacterium HGW-Elusimicrobia-2]|nr:MAG: hypothetical protein CVU78_06015 [Elusimicrobia bacterium HGW-Elusimicrobia-2]
MNKNKPERHNPWELFEYSIAHLNQKRLATAQAFWAMSLESYVKYRYFEKYKKQPEGKLELWKIIDSISSKGSFLNNTLHKLRDKRNDIIHEGFICKEEFEDCLTNFLKLFDEKKKIEEIRKNVDKERQTDLAVQFKDRVFYDDLECQSMEYSKIEENDFYDDSKLEKKVWNLKYKIESLFKKDKKYGGLQTGLISDFGVSSEWIWLPIGFVIKKKNRRVRKAVISILIFRDRKVRIYLDFGTNTQKARKEYYKLLKTGALKEQLKELISNNNEKNMFFWNVKHYSIFEKTNISIKDWLADKNRTKVNALIKNEIEKKNEKENWTYKNKRGNILLFGFEDVIEKEGENIDNLARKYVDYVYKLAPFLKLFDWKKCADE